MSHKLANSRAGPSDGIAKCYSSQPAARRTFVQDATALGGLTLVVGGQSMLAMPFADNTFDLVVSSLAIHNIDERHLRNHSRRLQAVSEAVRVLKPGGSLLITDLLWTRRYAQHLRELGMHNVEQRPSGWRFWYLPFVGADLVTATKPPQQERERIGTFLQDLQPMACDAAKHVCRT